MQGLLSEYPFTPLAPQYGEDVRFDLEIPLPQCERFLANFVERTAGRGQVTEHP